MIANGIKVSGYYALAAGGLAATGAPGKVKRNMPDPVPVMVLGRLAIDQQWQGRGLGADLLQDAVLRTMQAASIGGNRALMMHVKDERAAKFYRRNGFVDAPLQPLLLFLSLHPLPASALRQSPYSPGQADSHQRDQARRLLFRQAV